MLRNNNLALMKNSKRDVKGSIDPESEEEKYYFLSAIVKSSKKREKISPGAEDRKTLKDSVESECVELAKIYGILKIKNEIPYLRLLTLKYLSS